LAQAILAQGSLEAFSTFGLGYSIHFSYHC